MDIQLYNYKNEYGQDGQLKKVLDDNSNSIVAVITVNGQKFILEETLITMKVARIR